jgi:hypothetical protein
MAVAHLFRVILPVSDVEAAASFCARLPDPEPVAPNPQDVSGVE